MPDHVLFQPSQYGDISPADRSLLEAAYSRALDALRRNITPKGFSACSLADNSVYGTDVNYRSVWARDGAMTVVWTLDLALPVHNPFANHSLFFSRPNLFVGGDFAIPVWFGGERESTVSGRRVACG